MSSKKQFRRKQFQFFRRNLAIDLGTNHTIIWSPGKGNLLSEPSVLAIDTRDNSVYSSGREAYNMLGRAPSNIEVIKPLQDGVIASFNYTVKMLEAFLDKAISRSPVIKYRLIFTVPYSSTQVERQAVITAGKRIGIKNIYLIEEPLAAAMGTGLPVNEARGNFLINLGGGVTEIAVISLGGIVKAKSLRHGGNSLNTSIQRYIYKKYLLEIGESTAAAAKETAGYAVNPPEKQDLEIKGLNRKTMRPDRITVPLSDITEAMYPVLSNYCTMAKKIFEQTPPQLTTDIIKEGIFITGGGSLLHNIDVLFSQNLELPVIKVEEPFTNAARGAGMALQYMRFHLLDLYRA